jgi:hypothetical protein
LGFEIARHRLSLLTPWIQWGAFQQQPIIPPRA